MKARHIILNIFLLVSSSIICLVGLELFFRINRNFGSRYDFFRYQDNSVMVESMNRDIKDNYISYRPSATLGYELVPNSSFEINSYGMKSKEYKLEKAKGVYRILLLGDSIAFQNYSAVFLEEKLNNNSNLNKKYKFEIWNAGVPSYDVRRYANYLKYKGMMYNPDMVLIFFWYNDLGINTCVYYKTEKGLIECDFSIKELCKIYTPNPFLLKHSYLYRFIVMRFETYLLKKKIKRGTDPQEEGGKFYLNEIKELCQKKQIPLLGVLFCYLKPFSEYSVYDKRDYALMKKALGDSNINYIDLYNYLPEGKRYMLRDKKDDETHPSKEGHKIVAEVIYDYLLTNSIIY